MGSSAVYQCNASNQYGYLLANAFVSILGGSPPVKVCTLACVETSPERIPTLFPYLQICPRGCWVPGTS